MSHFDQAIDANVYDDLESDDLVLSGCECPACGESRMDYLEWDEAGAAVTCATCGMTYEPDSNTEGDDPYLDPPPGAAELGWLEA